jgi:protein TonB
MAATVDVVELRRWAASAAVVLLLHATAALLLTRWHEPIAGDEGTAAIVVDLAPFAAPANESKQDIAPGPLQQEAERTPEPQVQKPEEKPEEKVELPPAPNAEVVLPQEPDKNPDTPQKEVTPPVPQTTAPPLPRPSAAQVASWHRKIATQVERHKGYPAAARSRRETGIAQLAFTIDRQGMVLASRVVRSSGSAALDQETIATVRRAQPFPPPPPNMPGDRFDFSVPIRFDVP